jgi:quercetin dioxygenase-like cupin family protein
MTLVKQPIFRVVLVALQAGAEIGGHETESPITVQVIEGRLAIRVGADELVLGAGQLLVLRPGLRHTMSAQDDAAFLLTLAAEATHPAEHFA